MEIKIVKIGNSQGVILPKPILEKFQTKTFNVEEQEGNIILYPKYKNPKPRDGWKQAFAKATNPDKDIFEGINNNFDKEEWTW